jgi:hypothetical protein
LGNDVSENESPKGGEIPGMRKFSDERWNLAPFGLSRQFKTQSQGWRPGLSNLAPLGLNADFVAEKKSWNRFGLKSYD